MALSIVPCGDANESSGSLQSELSLVAERSHSKDQEDICSPLCSCNCCQITVVAFTMESLLKKPEHIKVYFSKHILFQKNNFAYQVYDHIWQPPKI